jgi:hypothetical protein
MEPIKIEVLGTGCRTCLMLFELARDVAREVAPGATVLYSTEVSRIIALGLINSPVLTINGKPVLVGVLPAREKLATLIRGYAVKSN